MWTDENVDKGSYFMIEYPDSENITQENADNITAEISKIERATD